MAETMIEYPNGHGSGHAGNDTSRERQQREDADGTTKRRQLQTLELVEAAGRWGITSAELENQLGVGHGQASSALSHLHRASKIARIKERRHRQEIYVLPVMVDGRAESPYKPRKSERIHPKFHTDETVRRCMDKAGFAVNGETFSAIRKFLEVLP